MFFFFQAEDGIRDVAVTGVQTCALPIYRLEREHRAHGLHPLSGRDRPGAGLRQDRKSTRLNSSHGYISYAVFCLKKKTTTPSTAAGPPTPAARTPPAPARAFSPFSGGRS